MSIRTLALWACMIIAGAATAQSTYTIRQGDTIEAIARRVGVSQSAIIAANPGVRPERMQIGQTLRIPRGASSRPSSSVGSSAPSSGGRYVVRNGDSDWSIARRHGITMRQLHAMNPGVDFSPLQIGVRLRVPGDGGTATRVQTASAPTPRVGGTHVVRAGDNDWTLARRFGITMRQLHAMNPGVDFSPLQIGVRLNVPRSGSSLQASPNRVTTRNVKITASAATVRRRPSTSALRVTTVERGRIARVLDRDGQWFRLRFANGTEGWVRSDLLAATSQRMPTVAAAPPRSQRATPQPKRTAATGSGSTGLAVLDRANDYLGVRYRFGGTSRSGFDCSGFVQHVFRTQGVRLPRTSIEQSRVGTPVSRANLRKGDLVFFRTRGNRISHVGIYQGGGRFIHASSGGGSVEVDSLTSGYYDRRFAGARRVLSNPRPAAKSPAPPRASAPAGAPETVVGRRADPPGRTTVGADEIAP